MSVCIEILILVNKHLHVLKGIDFIVLNLPSCLKNVLCFKIIKPTTYPCRRIIFLRYGMFQITKVYQAPPGIIVMLFFSLITAYLAGFIVIFYCCTQ